MMGLYLPWDKPKDALEETYETRFAEGRVTWKKICKKTGKVFDVETFTNLITFQATTAMPRMAIGDAAYRISHIYGEVANVIASGYAEGVLNGLTASRSDTVETMRTAPRYTTGAEEPVLLSDFGTTIEISSVPTTDYDKNILTVYAVFSDPALDDEIFVGAGLVVQVAGTELLFAHSYRPGLVKLSSFSVGCAWSVRFL